MISLGAPLFLLALPLPVLVWLWAPRRRATGPVLSVPFDLDVHDINALNARRLKPLLLPFLTWALLIRRP